MLDQLNSHGQLRVSVQDGSGLGFPPRDSRDSMTVGEMERKSRNPKRIPSGYDGCPTVLWRGPGVKAFRESDMDQSLYGE